MEGAGPPEAAGGGGQDSTDSAAVDSLEGIEPSDSKPWDRATGSHQSLAPTGQLLVDEGSAGAPGAEPASSSPPEVTVTEVDVPAGGAVASGVASGPSGSPSEAEASSGAPGDAEGAHPLLCLIQLSISAGGTPAIRRLLALIGPLLQLLAAVGEAAEGAGQDSLGGDSQDVWKPTWPAEEDAAAQAPPTAPIAVPPRRAEIGTKPGACSGP